MSEFDWYGDGGPVGGYGNNTSGGGGDDSGGGSGGANIMIVEFTDEVPQQTGSEFTSSKSAEEVYNHVMSGGIAFILCPYIYPNDGVEAHSYLLPVCSVVKKSNSTYVVGGSCKNGDGFRGYVAEIDGTTGYCVGSQ